MATSTVRPVDAVQQLPAVCRLLATHGADALPAVLGLLRRAIGAPVSFRAGDGPAALAVPRPGTVPSPRRASTGVELPVAVRERVFGMLVVDGPLPRGLGERDTAGDSGGGGLELLRATADVLALVLAATFLRSEREAAAGLLHLDEEERSELADQLHDSLVQSLVAARYLADLAARAPHPSASAGAAASVAARVPGEPRRPGPLNPPDAVDDAAGQLREAVQAALYDGRHVLARLRPRALDGLGVLAAIRSLLPDGDADRVVVGPSVPTRLPDVVGVAAFRFVQAAVTDLLARGLEPGLVHVVVVGGNLELWVRGEPARRPSVEYPWAARCPEEPDPSCTAGITRWMHRLRLVGGGGVLDDLSAHAWLPLSDGSSTAGPVLDAGRKT